ncbi:MAG TPA: competence/damage-inducible protein A [Halothiobacillaceae bacterium]|nr:competence/damage-inducible protein A [Halothiobacillaceae bacterium]
MAKQLAADNPIGVVVIGDEILSGRRTDCHLPAVIERLTPLGRRVDWSLFIGDEPERITQTLKQAIAEQAVVFCFGGIGATPDDLTRACAAQAVGRPLIRHPQAEACIVERFGDQAYPKRVLMADLPEGAGLLPNPVNNVPGFYIDQLYFMPGFPAMAHPMLDWILANRLGDIANQDYIEQSVWVVDTPESELIDLMELIQARWPAVRLFSLPVISPRWQLVELGAKGPQIEVTAAIDLIKDTLREQGVLLYLDDPR